MQIFVPFMYCDFTVLDNIVFTQFCAIAKILVFANKKKSILITQKKYIPRHRKLLRQS